MKYYYNPNIHNFGNIGLGGKIHAQVAPLFTKFIDYKRYNGRDIRKEIIDNTKDYYKNPLIFFDLCSGVGYSTDKFGLDTSMEMILKSRSLFPKKRIFFGNAENYQPEFDVDIVTCMFAFHEMPLKAQENVIENSLDMASKEVKILDISPTYKASKMMISGEPYLNNYLETIEDTMNKYNFKKLEYIENHATLWTKKRSLFFGFNHFSKNEDIKFFEMSY
jgi:hypothetical protein